MARKTNYSKNGTDYYRVTASVGRDSNGKLIRKEFYGKNKKDAEDKRDEYLNGIRNGLNPDHKNAILGDLMHSWLFEVKRMKVKDTSFERYEGLYRNHLKGSDIYSIKLNELQSIQVQRFYNKLYDSGITSESIKYLNKFLKSFLSYAVGEGYLLRNPCSKDKISIPGENDIEVDVEEDKDVDIAIFTDEEVATLKKSLEGCRYKCLILFALGTGLRQGELLALTWDDLADDFNEVSVTKTIKRVKKFTADGKSEKVTKISTPKSKTSKRVVPIPSKLIPVIKEHRLSQKKEKVKAGESYIENNYVFASEVGTPIDAKNLYRSYKNLLIKANIPHRKFHALRHTYATKLFMKNVKLKTVQILLGHSDISITANIYTHVMPKEKTDAAEMLNDIFI